MDYDSSFSYFFIDLRVYISMNCDEFLHKKTIL